MSAVNLVKPKIQHRFRVIFKTTMGILDETIYPMSHNLVNVSKYCVPSLSAFGLFGNENVTFTFQDDVDDKVYDGIQTLTKSQDLEIELHYLDGSNNILRAIKFEEANIGHIEYGALDYNKSDAVTIKLTVSYTDLKKI